MGAPLVLTIISLVLASVQLILFRFIPQKTHSFCALLFNFNYLTFSKSPRWSGQSSGQARTEHMRFRGRGFGSGGPPQPLFGRGRMPPFNRGPPPRNSAPSGFSGSTNFSGTNWGGSLSGPPPLMGSGGPPPLSGGPSLTSGPPPITGGPPPLTGGPPPLSGGPPPMTNCPPPINAGAPDDQPSSAVNPGLSEGSSTGMSAQLPGSTTSSSGQGNVGGTNVQPGPLGTNSQQSGIQQSGIQVNQGQPPFVPPGMMNGPPPNLMNNAQAQNSQSGGPPSHFTTGPPQGVRRILH